MGNRLYSCAISYSLQHNNDIDGCNYHMLWSWPMLLAGLASSREDQLVTCGCIQCHNSTRLAPSSCVVGEGNTQTVVDQQEEMMFIRLHCYISTV